MLVARKPKTFDVSPTCLKLEIWLESRLTGHWVSLKNSHFSGIISFLWLASTGIRSPFFKVSRLKLQKLLKSGCASEMESEFGWFICWQNFVRIATHSEDRLWNLAKSTHKTEFYPCIVCSARAILWDECHAKSDFALCSNNKNELEIYTFV